MSSVPTTKSAVQTGVAIPWIAIIKHVDLTSYAWTVSVRTAYVSVSIVQMVNYVQEDSVMPKTALNRVDLARYALTMNVPMWSVLLADVARTSHAP